MTFPLNMVQRGFHFLGPGDSSKLLQVPYMKAVNLEGPPRAARREAIKDLSDPAIMIVCFFLGRKFKVIGQGFSQFPLQWLDFVQADRFGMFWTAQLSVVFH